MGPSRYLLDSTVIRLFVAGIMSPIKGQVAIGGLGICVFLAASLPLAAASANLINGFDTDRLVVMSTLAAGAVALAIAASLWALAEQKNGVRLRRVLRSIGAHTKSQLGERDALLRASRHTLQRCGSFWNPRSL